MNGRGKRPRLLVLGTGMRHSVTSRCDEHIIASPPPLNRDGQVAGTARPGDPYDSCAFVRVAGPSLLSLASSLVKRAIVSRGESQSGAIFADLTPILALSLLRETSSHLSAPQLSQIEANLMRQSDKDHVQQQHSHCDQNHHHHHHHHHQQQQHQQHSFNQTPALDTSENFIAPGSSGPSKDWILGHRLTAIANGDGEDWSPADDILGHALQRAISQSWEEQVRRLRGQTRGCPERGIREDVRSYYGRLAEYQRRRLADIGERLRDAYGREGATVRTSKLIGPISHPLSGRGSVSHQRASLPFQGASTSSALMRKSRQEAILSGRSGSIGSVTRAVGSTGSGASSGSSSRVRPVTRTGSRTGSSSTPMGILLPPRRK